MSSDHVKAILQLCHRLVVGTSWRFGRTTKTKKRFVGTCTGIIWKGPSKRKGGAFFFLGTYKHHVGCAHNDVIRLMMADYQAEFQAKDTSTKKAVTATHDLEFKVNGTWISLGKMVPSKVRELDHESVDRWLEQHGELKIGFVAPQTVEAAPPTVRQAVAPIVPQTTEVQPHTFEAFLHDRKFPFSDAAFCIKCATLKEGIWHRMVACGVPEDVRYSVLELQRQS